MMDFSRPDRRGAQGATSPEGSGDPACQFLAAMRAAGIGAPKHLIADGKIHRFQGEGDKRGSLNSWYQLHLDGFCSAGSFGNWRLGVSEKWRSGGDGRILTEAERGQLSAAIAAGKAERELEREQAQEAAALAAADRWERAPPAPPDHPYLAAKKVRPHDLRLCGRVLLVPLHDFDRKLWNIQTISQDGAKLFSKGGRVKGLFSPIGSGRVVERVIIAEGWATGATLHEETGWPVLVALNADNLAKVAAEARKRRPDLDIIIAADDDRFTRLPDGRANPGAIAAAAAADVARARVIAPTFPEGSKGTDWNDRHRELLAAGLPGVAPEIEAAFGIAPRPRAYGHDELPPDEASSVLGKSVREWLAEGLSYNKLIDEPPRVGIRAPAGLGKTSQTLQALAELAAGRTTRFLVPTHKLAGEVVELAKAKGIDAVSIHGRGSPGDPAALCRKADIAQEVHRAGLPVWESLCMGRGKHGGQCELFRVCPYVQQFEDLEGKLIVMAHQHMTTETARLPKPDLVIVDERFYTVAVWQAELPAERLDRPLPADANVDRKEHQRVASKAKQALAEGVHPRDLGLRREELDAAAKAEADSRPDIKITPRMTRVEQSSRADEALRQSESRRIERIFREMAKSYDRESPSQQINLCRGIQRGGEAVDRIIVDYCVDLKLPKVPTLLIDADLDPIIAERFLPGIRIEEIKATLNVDVTQVFDTVCSRAKLTGGSKPEDVATAARTVARIQSLINREAMDGSKVLVCTYKCVAEKLAEPAGGAIVWFGSIRGLDIFKDFDVVIIAGREQPSQYAIEATARAMFGGTGEPLNLHGEYIDQTRAYRMRDGSGSPVTVKVHPDRRCQAILEQCREREIEQAVARLRLIHRKGKPGRVILLSNIPTNLPVDRLVTWDELLPDKAEASVIDGRGVELHSASEMARCFPHRWPTAAAAKQWRHRQDKDLGPKGVTDPDMKSNRETLPLSGPAQDLGPQRAQNPYTEFYREMGPFDRSVVSYRLEGHTRGSPHLATMPAGVTSLDEARLALELVTGPVASIKWHEPRPATALPLAQLGADGEAIILERLAPATPCLRHAADPVTQEAGSLDFSGSPADRERVPPLDFSRALADRERVPVLDFSRAAAAREAVTVNFWRHGEVMGAPRQALVPAGPLFDAADWLDDLDRGPVAIIEEAARGPDFSQAKDPVEQGPRS